LKKTTIIFSFILIAVFSAGNYLLHLMYLENYKKDFREYIIKHKKEVVLTSIEINVNELYVNSASLYWEDDNQEVIYKGKLYDIILLQAHGEKITMTVVSDDEEADIKEAFADEFTETGTSRASKGPLRLLKDFFALKYTMSSDILLLAKPATPDRSFCSFFASHWTSHSISKETPPPDFSMFF